MHDPSQFIQRALQQRKIRRRQGLRLSRKNELDAKERDSGAGVPGRGNMKDGGRGHTNNSPEKGKSKRKIISVDPAVRDSVLLVERSECPFSDEYKEVWKSIHKRHSSTLRPNRGYAKQDDSAAASHYSVISRPAKQQTPPTPPVDWTWSSMEYANLQDRSGEMWLASATQEMRQFKSLEVFGLMKLREAQLVSDSTDVAPPSKLVLVLCRRLLGQVFSNRIRDKELNLLGAIISELLFHSVFARARLIKNNPDNSTRGGEQHGIKFQTETASQSTVLTWHETCHRIEKEKGTLSRKLTEIEGTITTYMQSFSKLRDGVAKMASRWQKPATRTYFTMWQKAVEAGRQGRRMANMQSANLKLIRLAMSVRRYKSDGNKLSSKTSRPIRAFLKLMLQAWRTTTVESNRSNVSKTKNTLEAHMATCRRQMLISKEKLFTLKREKVRVMSAFMDISKTLNEKRRIYRQGKLRIESKRETVIGNSLNTLSTCSSGFFEEAFMAMRVLEETEALQMWMPESTSSRLYLSGRDARNRNKKWCTGPIQRASSITGATDTMGSTATADNDYGYSIEIADVRAREFANTELDLLTSGDIVPFENMMDGATLLLRSHGGCRSDFEALVERIVSTESKLLPWRHELGGDGRIKSQEHLQQAAGEEQSGKEQKNRTQVSDRPVVDAALNLFRHLRQEMAALKEEESQKAVERAKRAKVLRHEQRRKEKQANAGLAGLVQAAKESKDSKESKNTKTKNEAALGNGTQEPIKKSKNRAQNKQKDVEDSKSKALAEAAQVSQIAMEIDRLRVFLARLEMLSQASNRR